MIYGKNLTEGAKVKASKALVFRETADLNLRLPETKKFDLQLPSESDTAIV